MKAGSAASGECRDDRSVMRVTAETLNMRIKSIGLRSVGIALEMCEAITTSDIGFVLRAPVSGEFR